jgi:hypothetical protein
MYIKCLASIGSDAQMEAQAAFVRRRHESINDVMGGIHYRDRVGRTTESLLPRLRARQIQ